MTSDRMRSVELLREAHRLMDAPDWSARWAALVARMDAIWMKLDNADCATVLAEAERLYRIRIGD